MTLPDYAQGEITGMLDELFKSGAYSDLTITCGKDQYNVHKAIVCPRSPFFKALTGAPFKEGHTGVVRLDHDDPEAVKFAVEYFYHLDYQVALRYNRTARDKLGHSSATTSLPIDKDSSNLILHVRVYALGEKYGIEGLKKVALEKFKKLASYLWPTADFLEAAQEVYTSTVESDRGLRDAVVETCGNHPGLLDREDIKSAIKSMDLAFDLIQHFRNKMANRGW